MKILVHPSDVWVRQYTCKECQALLEVERSDLKVGNNADARDGETWVPWMYFTCPVCGTTEEVHDLPTWMESNMFAAARSQHEIDKLGGL